MKWIELWAMFEVIGAILGIILFLIWLIICIIGIIKR